MGDYPHHHFFKEIKMTIQTLITTVTTEKPNSFGNAKLVGFVNEVEANVAEQLQVHLPIYTVDDLSKELLAPSPYDMMYISYLKAKIDYANEEYASYQLNAEQYMQDFEDFVDWIVRTKQVQDNRKMPRRFRHVY